MAARVALGRGTPAQREYLRNVFDALRHERPPPSGWRDTLMRARRGFLPVSRVLYGLELDAYVSDYARDVRSRRINGEAGVLLDDKLAFYSLMRLVGARVPRLLGVLRHGRLTVLEGGSRPASPRELLDRHGAAVAKPAPGGGGRGIHLLHRRDGGYEVNGEPIEPADLDALFDGFDYHILTEFVEQGEFSRSLFSRTTNTLRLLTMWPRSSHEPFVAAAVQRIGTQRSYPVDNWSRGGMSAAVDVRSGRIGTAVTYPTDGRLVRHERHPDTGTQVAGALVPEWAAVAAEVLAAAARIRFLSYVGWDVILTDSGPVILEGNSYPDVNLMQAHGPLLADERVRGFYEEHGVL